MTPELEKQLVEKYPKIFVDGKCVIGGSLCIGDGWNTLVDKTCAVIQWHIDQEQNQIESATQYNSMVVTAQGGNWELFDKYFEKMSATWRDQEHKNIEFGLAKLRKVPKPVEQVIAVQVKEKFGGLRFYIDGGDKYTDGVITLAESMSFSICEVCGHPGIARRGGWIRVLCDEHETEYQQKLEKGRL